MIASFQGKYRFLSNFWPSTIVYDNIKYPTVEHAFQATKTLDLAEKLAISNLTTPGQAKKAGKNVELRSDWEQVKLQVMLDLLRLKFQNSTYKQLLLDTGDQELVEGNTWGDTFWGVCQDVGENNLGKLLMKVREECAKNV